MARSSRSRSIKAIASHRAEDAMWGIPESPEFSVVQHLLNEFKSHESDEAEGLKIYQKIADDSEDPLVRFLLNLIVADEERHHQIIGRMIEQLRDDLASTRPERVPREKLGAGAKQAGLREMLDHFIDVERKGIKEYERLSKASKGLEQDLFGLLCRTMIHDSVKHIAILEFLRRRVRQAKKSAKKRSG